jgi:hypothetical protein
MNSMRERLGQAIWRGTLLSAVVVTACGGKSDEDDQQNTTGSGGTSSTGGKSATGGSAGTSSTSGGTGGTGGSVANNLPLLPSNDYPACSGPEQDGGYYGQCCVSPHCYTPTSGACAPADEVSSLLPEFPPGSGSCSCIPEVGEGLAVVGPYRGRPEVTPVSTGECCYLVGSISCEGRPLLIAGVPRVAGLRKRADWARASLWTSRA